MRPRIISGGQTGADKGALLGAWRAGLETGGTAAQGYNTERGRDPSLVRFGLVECESYGYPARTEVNVKNSDGTVIFADKLDSPGTTLTEMYARKHNKPYIINPTYTELEEFARGKSVINIAGNRQSVAPGIQERVSNTIYEVFRVGKPF